MFASEIALPRASQSKAEEFDRKADEFAALAEDASTYQDVVRYRDLEQEWRLKATAERLSQIAHLYAPSRSSVAA